MYTKPKGMQGMKGKEKERDKEGWRKKSGGVNREEGEGMPGDSGFGCLCYQFAQKCQSTVTFSPTASPAAQPLLCNTHATLLQILHTRIVE